MSSSRIDPSTFRPPTGPGLAETEDATVSGPTTRPAGVAPAHADTVCAWKSDEASAEREFASREQSPGEKFLFDRVKTMAEGDVANAEVGGKLKALLNLEGSVKARVELTDDGTYRVRIMADGAVGEAAGNTEALALTGGAAYTFALQTPEGVADLLQGAGQFALLEASGVGAGMRLGLIESDTSLQRLAHYAATSTESMGLDAGARASLGKKGALEKERTGFSLDMTFAKAGLETEGSVGIEFNPNTSELTLEARIEDQASAKAMMAVLHAVRFSGKVKAEVKARARVRLTGDEVRELLDGRTVVAEMAGRLAMREKKYDVVLSAAGGLDMSAAVAGLAGDVKLQTTMSPEQFAQLCGNPLQALSPELGWEAKRYSAKETAVGTFGFDVELVEARIGWTMQRLKSHHSGSLPGILGELANARPAPEHADIQARAAVANLSK